MYETLAPVTNAYGEAMTKKKEKKKERKKEERKKKERRKEGKKERKKCQLFNSCQSDRILKVSIVL